MRRTKQLLAAAVLVSSFAFTACSGASSVETADETAEVTVSPAAESETREAKTDGKILIAYFSVMETDGVDTVSGASRVAVNGSTMGNNEYIASLIEQETGGDLFSIETVQEYPTVHDSLLEFAYNEKAENARPELSSQIENLDSYDTIFLGYPIWNSDLPMPLYTFLEEYDLSGKTIIPFVVHGGSGFSGTVSTIRQMQPKARVLDNGFSVSRNDAADSANEVSQWVQSLGITK